MNIEFINKFYFKRSKEKKRKKKSRTTFFFFFLKYLFTHIFSHKVEYFAYIFNNNKNYVLFFLKLGIILDAI